MKIKIEESFRSGGYEVFIVEEMKEGQHLAWTLNTSHETVGEGMMTPKAATVPFAKMHSIARALLDGLTEAGFNTAGAKAEARIKALETQLEETKRSAELHLSFIENHLSDLRRAYGVLLERFVAEGPAPKPQTNPQESL